MNEVENYHSNKSLMNDPARDIFPEGQRVQEEAP